MKLSHERRPQIHFSDRGESRGRTNELREPRNDAECAHVNPGKTVLFVDDEPAILEMRRLIFESLGYAALTAASGTEALRILRANKVDAIVLDYMMPGLDGEETARRIRRTHGNIPIISSSGCLSLPQGMREAISTQVEKGAGPQALIDAVEQQLYLER